MSLLEMTQTHPLVAFIKVIVEFEKIVICFQKWNLFKHLRQGKKTTFLKSERFDMN